MKRVIILLLLLAAPALAENDFTSDPNCVDWWNFDNDSEFGVSGSSNGTYFTRWGTQNYITPSATRQQGDASMDFEASNSLCLETPDANLPADFPCKNGTTNNLFTACFWWRPENVTQAFMNLVAKRSSTAQSWTIYFANGGPDTMKMTYWYGASTRTLTVTPTTAFAANQWYFMGFVCDDPNDQWYLEVWDDTNVQLSTASNTWADAINCGAAPFCVGGFRGGSGDYADGLLDDVRIFNRELSAAELAAVRADTLDMAAEPNLVAWYEMDTGGAVTDSSGNGNYLISAGGCHTTAYQQGDGSFLCTAVQSQEMFSGVLDADLPAGFPAKNGETDGQMTVCYWHYVDTDGSTHVGKGEAGDNTRSWHIVRGTGGALDAYLGNSDGSGWEVKLGTGVTLTDGRWYHVSLRIDDNADPNTYEYRIWGETEGSLVYTQSGTYDHGHAWNVEAGAFCIGGEPYAQQQAGLIDELVISNDIMTDDEIDAIRGGTYGGTSINNWWWRRRHSN